MSKKRGLKSILLILFIAVSGFYAASLLAQEANEPYRSRVYSLRNITAAQGMDYLSRLRLGTTVSQIQKSNAIIVTASPVELVKVSTVLDMVDSKQSFVIDRIGAADMNVPKFSMITEKLDGVSLGTFTDPPSRSKKFPAILDVQDGSTVLVSPEGMSDNIIRVVNQLKAAPKETDDIKAEESSVKVTEEKTALAQPAAEANDVVDEEMLDRVVKQLLKDQNQPPAPANEPKQKEIPKPAPQEPQEPAETILPKESPVEAAPAVEPNKEKAADIRAFEPVEIPQGQEELQLRLPETVDVVALLDLVRQYLNINYLYDPAKITGTVTLKIRDNRIKVSELYALMESVLKFKGFVMSRRGNLVTIVPAAEALNIDPTIKAGGEQVKAGDVIVTAVYNLKYVTAATAQTLLTNMKLGTSLNPVTETNVLIVTDYAYRMDRIDRLIALIDQPGAPKQFKFRQLKYTLASALVPKIQSIAQQIGTDTINVQTGAATGRPAAARPTPRPATPGQPAAQANQSTIFLDYDERTNRILMVGQEKEIDLINELVDSFDVPQQDLRTIKEYEIQYVDAMQIVDTLSTLGIATSTGGSTQTRGARIPSPQVQPPPGQAGAGGTAGASPTEEPQIAVLETTNSLLVNATPEQHAQIVMVIAYVDRQPAELAIPYVVYPLEFQKPSELKPVLTELIEKTIKDKEGKVTQTVSRGEDITIVADDKAFSVIVYANRKNQEWVGNLIRQLDKKRPQVLIDVTLVEITRDDAFDYDLQLATGTSDFGTTDGSPPVQVPIINRDAGGVHTREFGSGPVQGGKDAGGGQFFYSDKNIQILLTAMEKKSYGRVLAKPKILVNDNEEGKISTTQTTYRAQDTVQVPTTGPSITSTTYQPYDAKIELSIKPHISEGDLLLLEVKMTREDFAVTSNSAAPPNKTASNVDSKVLVPDGATIILGGMVKLNQNKGGNKVPILGDIPLVGILFRGIHNSDIESKLYIFVKAYALRPIEGQKGLPQAEAISEINRKAFERGEAKFQKYNDIPGLTPKPLEPLKVLEEE